MTYDRFVILFLLLLLLVALFRPQPQPVSSPPSAVAETPGRDVLAVIHARKSVRAYTDAPVSREQLETLMRAGMAAPSAGNAQPWSFVAVTERATLDALADVLPYGKMLKKAPAAIAVCGVASLSSPGKAAEMWVQDCSAATENILLAAEGIGLGAVWIGVYPNRDRLNGVTNVLKLPAGVTALCVVSIGHPTGVEKAKDKFKADRIHWQAWEKREPANRLP